MAGEAVRAPKGVIVLACEYAPFPGGIATYASELVRAVRAAGYAARVVAPAYPDLPCEADPDVRRVLGHHAFSTGQAALALATINRAPGDLLLLAADIRSVLLAYGNRLLGGRPYRAMIHGSEVSKFAPGSPLRAIVRRAYHRAVMVSSNSAATLSIFSANFGAPRRGVVNYLGVDPHWFHAVDGPFEHPDLARLEAGVPIVCTVGRIEPRKGQREALQVMARLRRSAGLRDVVYVAAGRAEDQDYAEAVRAGARELGVRVVLPGRLSDDDVSRLYRRSLCHLLPAQQLWGKIEGFGLVLLEAGAQACPSVTTRVGGIPEVLGESGIICEAGDLDAMARTAVGLFRDAGLRSRAGEAARENARRFNWRACAAGTFPELGIET
jgi:phosphatidylinositol alpha-1,6-mannosyltransferase